MVSKRAREIIEREMPGAQIIEDHEIEHRPLPEGVVQGPSVEAMLKKWGGLNKETKPEAAQATEQAPAAAEAGEVVMVRVKRPLKDPSKVPASLRNRTLIVDEASGKIIGENG
jgi:hypothetical protein